MVRAPCLRAACESRVIADGAVLGGTETHAVVEVYRFLANFFFLNDGNPKPGQNRRFFSFFKIFCVVYA